MPPTEIPLEAGDTLAFTPPCLADLPDPPVFTLRAFNSRDQRQYRRMVREAGISRHSDEEIRDCTRRELKRLWSEEYYARHIEMLEEFWTKTDDWAAQRKHDPELKFEFDQAKLAEIDEVSDQLFRASPELRRMFADNAEANEMSPKLAVAVIVKDFANLDAKKGIEAGYLNEAGVDAISAALSEAEKEAEAPKGAAFVQLIGACVDRMKLSADTAKNSASPSPSGSDQKSSENGKAAASGKSRKSAPSTEKTSEA